MIIEKYLKAIEIDKVSGSFDNTIALIKSGIIIEPLVPVTNEQRDELERLYKFDFAAANSTFYKKFADRMGRDWEQVLVERLFHYLTTYGEFGDTMYEPNELDKSVFEYANKTMVKVQALEKDVVKEKLQILVNEPLALPTKDIEEFVDTLMNYNITEVKGNKEIQIALANKKHIALKDPHLFLRQLIHLITNKTELIKNKQFYKTLDHNLAQNESICEKINYLLNLYARNYGVCELAKHFRPNKKVWLIIRKYMENKRVINEVRRKANKVKVNHTQKTILELTSQEVTEKIQNMNTYQLVKTYNYLTEKMNIDKETRINNTGRYYQTYKIRNGKVFIQDEAVIPIDPYRILFLLQVICKELQNRYSNLNKTVYLPESKINIAMPTSVKNFIGSYPMYTSIDIPNQINIGIYWTTGYDLDLHGISATGRHIGFYSERDRNVVYSGDMTHLNQYGMAAESMLIKDTRVDSYTFNMSPFSRPDEYFIYIGDLGDVTRKDFETRNDIIKPSELLFFNKVTNIEPLTFLTTFEDRAVLSNFKIGGILPNEATSQLIIESVLRKSKSALQLEDFLRLTGATVIREKENLPEEYIDFSPEGISVSSFTDLLKLD